MNFYIRLLSYSEACKIIEFINNMPNCYANITTGGVSVECKGNLEKGFIKDELRRKFERFEITEDRPQQVKERIIDELGLK